MELMQHQSAGSIRVIDLDDASTRVISWDPNIPDQAFESFIDAKLRHEFGVTDEAWVDLFDPVNACPVHISKEVLSRVTHSLCLCLSPKTPEALAPMKKKEVFEVLFQERALGMTIREHNESVIVNELKRRPDGSMGAAEASGKIHCGDVIYKVQGSRTVGRSYDAVVQMLQTQVRPLSIQYFRPFPREGLHAVEFRTASLSMTITTDEYNVIVKDLPMAHPNMIGYAEAHGVRIGDIIHAVDGEIIRGVEYNRAVSLLSRPTRPMVVVFARNKFIPPTPTRSTAVLSNGSRYSFASSTMPSPRPGRSSTFEQSRRPSTGSAYSGGDGESMLVEDMLEYCEGLGAEGILTPAEVEIMSKMVLSMRPDLCCAVKRKNQNAVLAILKSPTLRSWDHLLKTHESILLAGPVAVRRKKKYHFVLTDHERLLFINKDTNLLEDEIMCSQIVTISSRSKFSELVITTSKNEYVIFDNFVGPVIWVRAILPFTCTQGVLKVASSRRFLGAKKRYFVLQGHKLTGYKKEQMMHQIGADSNSIMLHDATVEVTDPRTYTFSITTPELSKVGKKLVLTAPSSREFNKWVAALNGLRANAAPA
ncbi:hypothetical protein Poli38472_003606 [Pythium oligandrum]|uniref:PH domain-containing protein n=1 Tax=Pythium oligandrum TaxID=41045 RepID=A0A8K1CLI0_PYTOL|nr:hypothetical protein Poli38472_003606 [Pythium oligandrum]|eukprot:TMW65841.1 hypothetical protein Poli38472_003606 [Pythium oligandrum]